MAITNLFSKRLKAGSGQSSDVYIYDQLPNTLRVQIVQILNDVVVMEVDYVRNTIGMVAYTDIKRALCREYGIFSLLDQQPNSYKEVTSYILVCQQLERALDTIELCLKVVNYHIRNNWQTISHYARATPDEAIAEINHRFLASGVGYQFESDQLIRVDSKLAHIEIIKPVLMLLSSDHFSGPNTEFLEAFTHFRHKRYEECLNECLKSFESTMKVICDLKGWAYDKQDTAKKLIDILLKNGLIYSFSESQMGTLRALLESGIPTARNRLSGHGAGSEQRVVPQEFASYMLNITASTILLLVRSFETKS